MRIHRRQVLTGAAALAFGGVARAAPRQALVQFMTEGMARTHTPGLSVAVIREGQTVMSAGVGLADVAAKRPVTADTVFHIASVSKTVTATALMMQAQAGAFTLDEPIERFLDFKVVHPSAPKTAITFRHLLTHTSGISDKVYGQVPAFSTAGDPTLGLREFLIGYLTPQGQWFKADGCYGAAPGAAWDYSNVAVALLGYLSGRVGRELKAFTQDELFKPLGMAHTSWTYAGLKPAEVAVAYNVSDGTPKALPPTGYPDWPAGLLRTSANDFARFLSLYTKKGSRQLKPETVAAMLTSQALPGPTPDGSVGQGLIWQLRTLGDRHLATHAGGDPGASTVVAIDLERKVAVLAFANAAGNDDFRGFQKELVQRLLSYEG